MRFITAVTRTLASTVGVFLVGCSAQPPDAQVQRDLDSVLLPHVGTATSVAVRSIVPGEGDENNVYLHVRFDLRAGHDTTLASGCFAGLPLSSTRDTSPGEATLLYQREERGWKLQRMRLPCAR
jgi:hypothetical protein